MVANGAPARSLRTAPLATFLLLTLLLLTFTVGLNTSRARAILVALALDSCPASWIRNRLGFM